MRTSSAPAGTSANVTVISASWWTAFGNRTSYITGACAPAAAGSRASSPSPTAVIRLV